MPVREAIEQYSDREPGKITEWAASDGLLRIDEELIGEIFDVRPFERLDAGISNAEIHSVIDTTNQPTPSCRFQRTTLGAGMNPCVIRRRGGVDRA